MGVPQAAARPSRFPLAVLPTPLVRDERLGAAFGVAPLLVKRDDLIGFGAAGNKVRPLEHLIGAARDAGVEVFVTGGGPGSNFIAAAALAARTAGLACTIVLWGDPVGAPNVALAAAAGAEIVRTGRADRAEVEVRAAEIAAALTASGRPAVAVPRGGSTAIGALGFADAAAEVAAQLEGRDDRPSTFVLPVGSGGSATGLLADRDERPSTIVLPVGSGGSAAGLLAGLVAAGLDVPVLGVSVSRPPDEVRAHVLDLAGQCATLLGVAPPDPARFALVDARGAGFGRPSADERRHARVAYERAGLLVDPTYGAQALTAAVARARAAEGPVLWWHTGGTVPAVTDLVSSAVPAVLKEHSR